MFPWVVAIHTLVSKDVTLCVLQTDNEVSGQCLYLRGRIDQSPSAVGYVGVLQVTFSIVAYRITLLLT